MGCVFFLSCVLQSNKAAKLKQSKLDARRKQWISQGLFKTNKKMGFLFVCFDVYVGFDLFTVIVCVCVYICIFIMCMW